jgi:RecA/RadA recombinase
MKDKKAKADLGSLKAIEKEFGKVISKGNELIAEKKKLRTLSVSPSIDLALNGGLSEGTWNLFCGDPKSGKSTTCLQICKNAIDEGRPVIYLDAESRLKQYNLNGIEGFDLSKIQIIHSPEGRRQLSAEEYLKVLESLMSLPENKGAVCVIDSVSCLVPLNELEEDPSATIRASLPKLLTHWVKKNIHTVTSNRLIMLLITHYITNTSGYGKLKNPDGGLMIQFQSDTRMDISRVEPWEDSGKKIGQIVNWKVSWSSLGATGTECTSYLRYGKGIDSKKEVIELAEALSIIDKAGAWYSIPFLAGTKDFEEAPKFQGQSKLYSFLEERPDVFDIILSKVKELL